jgi:transcription antitermination factor NusG
MARHKDGWIILRTSGAKTIPLSESLAQAGFDVWTPRYIQTGKKGGKDVETQISIIPTFLFARAVHIADLAEISEAPVSQHPDFSFFRHAGRIPLIADSEIGGLRKAEEQSRVKSRRSKRRALVMGQRVKFTQGAFAGMGGEVVKLNRNGKAALVAFGGGLNVEIEAWQMPDDLVCNDTSELGESRLTA